MIKKKKLLILSPRGPSVDPNTLQLLLFLTWRHVISRLRLSKKFREQTDNPTVSPEQFEHLKSENKTFFRKLATLRHVGRNVI